MYVCILAPKECVCAKFGIDWANDCGDMAGLKVTDTPRHARGWSGTDSQPVELVMSSKLLLFEFSCSISDSTTCSDGAFDSDLIICFTHLFSFILLSVHDTFTSHPAYSLIEKKSHADR